MKKKQKNLHDRTISLRSEGEGGGINKFKPITFYIEVPVPSQESALFFRSILTEWYILVFIYYSSVPDLDKERP
jgi:hypothetical protein